MAKIASNTILILLYICFLLNSFSLVLSRTINYNYENSCAEETITEAGSLANDFQLQFNSGPNTEYIKIILTPLDNQETPHLCYSPTDTMCSKDRIVMATREDKLPAIACVKKKEVKSNLKRFLSPTKTYSSIIIKVRIIFTNASPSPKKPPWLSFSSILENTGIVISNFFAIFILLSIVK